MIKFVNAKLNLGLNIVRKREDGYHDLETVFYPVGKYNGTPENPEPFCDILEITAAEETKFSFTGREVECPIEKNLVYKAWKAFKENYPALSEYSITLEKHLPDGAGLGGGSADATFVLKMLNELSGEPFDSEELVKIALGLGADCPFFVYNQPSYAEGVGEKITPVDMDLSGWWCGLVKPEVSIPTKEAFGGVKPAKPAKNLREIIEKPIEEWEKMVKNDFEDSIFPNHPILGEIKRGLREGGAVYASMSGSGSTVYGLFKSREEALRAVGSFEGHYTTVSKL